MLRLVWKALVPRAVLRHPDQAGVHGAGAVAHRALEEQVARRVRRHVVLEGAVVEGLVAVAEVGGEQIAGGAATDEAAVRAHPRVVAAEAGQPGRHAGLRVGLDVEGADGPGGPVELLHADVADPRRTGEGDAWWRAGGAPLRRPRTPRRRGPRCRPPLAPTSCGAAATASAGPWWRTTIVSATVTPAGTSMTIGSAASAWCSQVRASLDSGRSPSAPAASSPRRTDARPRSPWSTVLVTAPGVNPSRSSSSMRL